MTFPESPHHQQIVDPEHQGCADPRKRIREADPQISEPACEQQRSDDPQYQFRRTRHHRNEGVPHALQNIPVDQQHSENNVAACGCVQKDLGSVHNLLKRFRMRRFQKETGEGGCKKNQKSSDADAEQNRDRRTFPETMTNSFQISRSEVLRREGRHGNAERKQRLDGNLFHLGGNCIGGNVDGAEGIQNCLKNYDSDRRDGELKRHRHRNPEMFQTEGNIEFPVIPFQLQDRELSADVEEAEKARHRLRDYRSPSRACNTALKTQNKQVVQNDIQNGGDDQKDQRRDAVSQCADDAGDHSVKDNGPGAAEDDNQIRIGIFNDVFRCVHPLQHGTAQKDTENCHDQCDDCAEISRGCDGSPYSVIITRSEPLSRDDGKSVRESEKESENEKHYGTR